MLIKKKEFIAKTFNAKNKTFVIYIAFISKNLNVHSFCKVQINFLKTNEILTFVLFKYANYADIFPNNLATKLLKQTKINNYTINLIKNKQLLYKYIYSLRLVESKILKTM